MDSYIIESNKKKSKMPARLDLAQSGAGLILGLFMWAHMFFVASILLGKGAFNFVARSMELNFLSSTGEGYPFVVALAVGGIFTLFIIHALLGMRKMPISWKQHRIIRDQMQMMNHTDTNYWYIQAATGFIMFFAGSAHLFTMLTHPAEIGPYMSADRFISGNMWPLYFILLICVELHGTIGLYRLCMKWGWFMGKDPRKSRKRLKHLKTFLTIFFLTLGFITYAMFVKIGVEHRDKAGEKFISHSAAVEQVESTEKSTMIEDKTGRPAEENEAVKSAEPVK